MSSDRTPNEIIDNAFKLLLSYGESGTVYVAMTALEGLKKHYERKPVKVLPHEDTLNVREHPLTEQQINDIAQAGDVIANLPAETQYAKSCLKQAKQAIEGTLKRLNPKQVFCIVDPNNGQYTIEKPVSKEQQEIEKLRVANDQLKKLQVEREAKDKEKLLELTKQLEELKKLNEHQEAFTKISNDKKVLATTSTEVPVLTKESVKEVTKEKK